MKLLKTFGFAALLTFGLAACNQAEEKTETIDLSEGTEEQTTTEDEGNAIKIDVKADEEGNVDGELSGDIELKDRK